MIVDAFVDAPNPRLAAASLLILLKHTRGSKQLALSEEFILHEIENCGIIDMTDDEFEEWASNTLDSVEN